MDKFNKTLTLLNNLIQRLQANTGGEVKNKMSTQQNTTVVTEEKKVEVTATNVEVSKEQNQKKVENKATEDVKKQTTEPANKDKGEKADKKAQKNSKKDKKQKVQKKQEQTAESNVKTQDKPKEDKKQKKQKGQKKQKVEKSQKTEKKQGETHGDQKKQLAEATIEDFATIDMRIGSIIQAWKHPESEKLYCQKIDICGEVRQIASGLQQYIPIQDMKGACLVMVNLKPRSLAKFMSNGMVISVSTQDHDGFKLVRPIGANSQRLYLEGHQQLFKTEQVLPYINAKKKILQRCLEHFRTDAQGYVCWKGIKCKTAGGYIKTDLPNGFVS